MIHISILFFCTDCKNTIFGHITITCHSCPQEKVLWSYSKTGHENGRDSQKVVAHDNNHLTDGEGPNNLNQEWCDRNAIKALTNCHGDRWTQADRREGQTYWGATDRKTMGLTDRHAWADSWIEDDRQTGNSCLQLWFIVLWTVTKWSIRSHQERFYKRK